MYLRAATETIEDIHNRGKIPLLVGGTGQYIRAVIEGWEIPPQEPMPELRDALERWGKELGPDALHARLATLDEAAAGRIEPRNLRRTVRALEVILGTGKLFSAQRGRKETGYRVCQLGLSRPRAALYERIDQRLEGMMTAGFLEEVSGLLAKGYPPDLPAFSAIGYKEMISYLQGIYPLEVALQLIRRKSRQFVRRQANWFQAGDPSIFWVKAGTTAFDQLRFQLLAFLEQGR